MAENELTKVCPLCAETIKAAAKVCPHCRKIQKRWFMSQHDLQAAFALLLIIALVVLVGWFFTSGREYSPSRHKIMVLSTQFGIEATRDNTNAVVSGILTNASDYAWKITGLEIRFLDVAGKVIDADKAGSEYIDLTVLPHAERAFHLNLHDMKAIPAFSTARTTVTQAKDPKFWLND